MNERIHPSPPDAGQPDASPGAPPDAGRPPLQPRETVSPGVTRRGVLIGVLIGVVAIVAALASVYFRRTQLQQTTRFWGRPAIRALQSSANLRLRVPPGGPIEIRSTTDDPHAVELGDVPGVSHLRHALLDQRHYRWETLQQTPVEVAARGVPNPEWVILELDGTPPGVQNEPEGEIQPVAIRLELTSGWVGLVDGQRSVRLTGRVQPAVRHFLLTTSNVRSRRYDER